MKKVVMKIELHDEKVKQKAMKIVSALSGVDSISMDMKDKKLTVTGDIDPITIVAKLRKLCHTEILTVGPAKEPEKKKDDGKKDDPKKKDDGKKDEGKKDDGKKKDEAVKAVPYPGYFVPPPQAYPAYYQQQHYAYNHQQQPQVPLQYHYNHRSVEEDPNSCVIC